MLDRSLLQYILCVSEQQLTKIKLHGTTFNKSFGKYKCNLQVWLLISGSKTMGTLSNYTCKSFNKLTPALKNPGYHRASLTWYVFPSDNLFFPQGNRDNMCNTKTDTQQRSLNFINFFW